jgi:hypothetical protein
MFGGILIIELLQITVHKKCLHDMPAVQTRERCSVIIEKIALVDMC